MKKRRRKGGRDDEGKRGGEQRKKLKQSFKNANLMTVKLLNNVTDMHVCVFMCVCTCLSL